MQPTHTTDLCLVLAQPAARRVRWAALLLLAAVLLAACGSSDSGAGASPAPTRTPLPTFTPTPLPAMAAAAQPAATQAAEPTAAGAVAVQAATSPAAPAETPAAMISPTAPATAAPAQAGFAVSDDLVNVRSGPATSFDVVGEAHKGDSFQIVAKNAAGDWWQVCCINGKQGWVFGQLGTASNVDQVAVAANLPAPAPTAAPAASTLAQAPASTPADTANATTATAAATAAPTSAPAAPAGESAGSFDANAQYQIVGFKVLGKDENNGGIRDSSAQHLIFVTVLDKDGKGVDGAIVKNLVGDHSEVTTGGKGPGKAEITMYWDPFKLTVASDPSGPVTSQVSNQMGLAFPHLPDIVGKLGGPDYEYAVCPTLEVNCQWPIHAVHFSYDIVFQKVK